MLASIRATYEAIPDREAREEFGVPSTAFLASSPDSTLAGLMMVDLMAVLHQVGGDEALLPMMEAGAAFIEFLQLREELSGQPDPEVDAMEALFAAMGVGRVQ